MEETLTGKVLKTCVILQSIVNFRGNWEKFFLQRFMSIDKAKKAYFTINSYSCKQIMEIINEKYHFLAIVETVLSAELAANFSTCKLFSQMEVSSHLEPHKHFITIRFFLNTYLLE